MTYENYQETNPYKYKLSNGEIITNVEYVSLLRSFSSTYKAIANPYSEKAYGTESEKEKITNLYRNVEFEANIEGDSKYKAAMEFDKYSRLVAYTHWNPIELVMEKNRTNAFEDWFDNITEEQKAEIRKQNNKKVEQQILKENEQEEKKMSYESHTANILQLGNTIGQLKDNFENEKCQVALSELEELKNSDELKADVFLSKIQNIMHVDEEKSHTVRHYIDEEEYNLRISNHSANAIHAKDRPNETSVVIKLSSVNFRNDNDSYLAEYVYNSKNLTKEKQLGIINGLQSWLQTGIYSDKNYDKEYFSPSKERYLEKVCEKQSILLMNINSVLENKNQQIENQNKELNIWTEKSENDNKRISELTEEVEQQEKTIQKQNQLLYGETKVEVNGVTRICPNGIVEGFAKSVARNDEQNQRIIRQNQKIENLNNYIDSITNTKDSINPNKPEPKAPKSQGDDGMSY